MKSPELAAGSSSSPHNEEFPSPQSDEAIPAAAAIPAAEPVERGRFVLHLHNRDDDGEDSGVDGNVSVNNDDNNNSSNGSTAITAPDSPKSFNSDEIFEDVECGEEQISDADLERLLGPPPLLRRTSGENDAIPHSLETDCNDDDSDDTRRKRPKKALCSCCPNVVRRGPCRMLLTMTGRDGSVPTTRVGNMIVVFPKCFQNMGFGIMGPHWFGPVVCVVLLTIATSHFAPTAYRNIGPLSSLMCILFYIIGIVSLCIVSCSDPGVVKPGGGPEGRGRNGYAGVPTMNGSAGRGWRYCDLCSLNQPPDAVHCPECNVCIEGYDHHCPWMGTCIGKKNFTSFMAFNLSWLFYLLYAIIWVSFFGAAFSDIVVDSSDDG